jgi:uncharacterized protein YbbC (DUF1343 family)
MALLINAEQQIGASVDVVRMVDWRREMLWADTGRTWVWPSPNMPHSETTLLYPGMVLLEGTNISEGRGTTLPFEVVGAPWIEPERLMAELKCFDHPGLALRPIRFLPTFDKYRGQRCGGIAFHVIDPQAVRSVGTALALLASVWKLYPSDFAWLPPPYEYEREKPPIDILFGSPRLRQRLAQADPVLPPEIAELTTFDRVDWQRRTAPFRLYPD